MVFKTLVICFCCGLVATIRGDATDLGRSQRLSESVTLPDYFSDASVLEAMRKSGDVQPQRQHVWDILVYLTRPVVRDDRSEPLFESWHGENELFGDAVHGQTPTGIRGFSRRIVAGRGDGSQATDVPVLAYTLYNDPAYEHILRYKLNEVAGLDRQLKVGGPDKIVAGDLTVPAFPARSLVLKTVWWPIAQDKVTALPVWDPETNEPDGHGNAYTSWTRVVAVDPGANPPMGTTTPINFAGRSFSQARRVGLQTFYHVVVDGVMAARMMRDRETSRAVFLALGRSLKAGDYIALVSANMMSREINDWIWGTFWWHDRAEQGPFSAGRPPALKAVWRNYLMQAAFDTASPIALDGGPHIAFNPWLEGRFPDGGHGSGITSNCMACHQRASYPQIGFLPVTRGPPDLRNDSAYKPGRLRTSFLWSLAMHPRP